MQKGKQRFCTHIHQTTTHLLLNHYNLQRNITIFWEASFDLPEVHWTTVTQAGNMDSASLDCSQSAVCLIPSDLGE